MSEKMLTSLTDKYISITFKEKEEYFVGLGDIFYLHSPLTVPCVAVPCYDHQRTAKSCRLSVEKQKENVQVSMCLFHILGLCSSDQFK